MIWVAGHSPTLVSQNLKATTLTYLAIDRISMNFVVTLAMLNENGLGVAGHRLHPWF
jgi:hypothetical protein